jgi:hypothetical protein
MSEDGTAKSTSCFGYYKRFLYHFLKNATSWARDNIIFALLVVVLSPVIAYLRDSSHKLDWLLIWETMRVYVLCLAVYVAIHLIRTAWKLDVERAGEIDTANAKITRLGEQIKTITNEPTDRPSKVRALSQEILGFARERIPDEPRQTVTSPQVENSAEWDRPRIYELQTLGIYRYKFERRVESILEDFSRDGIKADDFTPVWHPHNWEQIMEVSAALSKMADISSVRYFYCMCGKGRIVDVRREPLNSPHSWLTTEGEWRIDCPECAANYELDRVTGSIVRKSDGQKASLLSLSEVSCGEMLSRPS